MSRQRFSLFFKQFHVLADLNYRALQLPSDHPQGRFTAVPFFYDHSYILTDGPGLGHFSPLITTSREPCCRFDVAALTQCLPGPFFRAAEGLGVLLRKQKKKQPAAPVKVC